MNENSSKIIFVGGIIPKEIENDVILNSKGSIQNAANNLQWEIIRGLDVNTNNSVQIVNSLYIGSFPLRYKKSIIRSFKFSHNGISEDNNVGFINLPYVKMISRAFSIKRTLKKIINSYESHQDITVIAYAMTYPMVESLRYLNKKYPKIKTILIVPDLPMYMNMSKIDSKKTLFYRINEKILNKKIKSIDSFVLLTRQMYDKLEVKNKPFVVLEGIAPLTQNLEIKEHKTQYSNIVYTGGLSEEYGVFDLIKNFKNLTGDQYKLILCGHGNDATIAEIKKHIKEDKRIEYLGQLRKVEVIKIQSQATLLINPRNNNHIFTKYSFPSKILEYMSSGKPVLAYKLDGIPEEYSNFYYQIEEGEFGIHKSLNNFFKINKEESNKMGKNAQKFVLENKNAKVQTKKIIELINKIEKTKEEYYE